MDFSQNLQAEVFISFKNSDFSGNPTRDSVIAKNLYEELAARKVAVFYSNSTLLSLGQSVYKKSIDEALESTKVLIVVSTDINFLMSEWVIYLCIHVEVCSEIIEMVEIQLKLRLSLSEFTTSILISLGRKLIISVCLSYKPVKNEAGKVRVMFKKSYHKRSDTVIRVVMP